MTSLDREQFLLDSDRLSHRDEWHEPYRYVVPRPEPTPWAIRHACGISLTLDEIEAGCCMRCDGLTWDEVWERRGAVEKEAA